MLDSIISVRNITKSYNFYSNTSDRLKELIHPGKKQYHHKFEALKDVSFEVKRGESLGIIGKNGSGKSTLLKIIAGVITPSAGTYSINGKVSALLELGTGFNPELNGLENIYFSGAIMGLSKKELDDKLDNILSFADIGNFIHQPVKNYSSGMFVRLAFALAINVDPDILIVDEALAVGDIFFQQKCHQRIEQMVDSGVTLLMVTHGSGAVEKYAKNALLLDSGKLKYFGNTNEAVMRYYQLERSNYAAEKNILKSLPDQETSSTNENDPKLKSLKKQDFDLSQISMIANEDIVFCNYASLQNSKNEKSRIFQVGEEATFLYDFVVKEKTLKPFVGIELFNSSGILVFATNSLLLQSEAPDILSDGDLLEISQKVKLNVAPGEYTFNICFSQISKDIYAKAEDMSISSLYSHAKTPFRLINAGSFEVSKALTGVECQFGGLVGLESEILVANRTLLTH